MRAASSPLFLLRNIQSRIFNHEVTATRSQDVHCTTSPAKWFTDLYVCSLFHRDETVSFGRFTSEGGASCQVCVHPHHTISSSRRDPGPPNCPTFIGDSPPSLRLASLLWLSVERAGCYGTPPIFELQSSASHGKRSTVNAVCSFIDLRCSARRCVCYEAAVINNALGPSVPLSCGKSSITHC